MPNDAWKELGRDLDALGINSVEIPKKLYEMGWRKRRDSSHYIGPSVNIDSILSSVPIVQQHQGRFREVSNG